MVVPSPALADALGRARERGWIGGSVEDGVAHALGFLPLLPPGSGSAVDLGSGGGLPGLVLATARPDMSWLLVDADRERADHLRRAVAACRLGNASVRHCRAEELARGVGRGTYDAVVARSLARPWLTCEWAAPLLRPGGVLVVSARSGDTWPAERLLDLGLSVDRPVPGFVRLVAVAGAPATIPRKRVPAW